LIIEAQSKSISSEKPVKMESMIKEPLQVVTQVETRVEAPKRLSVMTGGVQHYTNDAAYKNALEYITEVKNLGGFDESFSLSRNNFIETTFQSTNPPRVTFKILVNGKECEYVSSYDQQRKRSFVLSRISDKSCPSSTSKSKIAISSVMSQRLDSLVKDVNSKLQSKVVENNQELKRQNLFVESKQPSMQITSRIQSGVQSSSMEAQKAILSGFKGTIFASNINFDDYFMSSWSKKTSTSTETQTSTVNGKSEITKIITVTTKFAFTLEVNNENCAYEITQVVKTGQPDSAAMTKDVSNNCKSILINMRSARIIL
jgi:hypothetical protein